MLNLLAEAGAAGGMGCAVRQMLEKQGFTVWALDSADQSDDHYIRTDITDSASVEEEESEPVSFDGFVPAVPMPEETEVNDISGEQTFTLDGREEQN